jgi:hypothetical protein
MGIQYRAAGRLFVGDLAADGRMPKKSNTTNAYFV